MASYLVTGGVGCVGSHLVEYLIKSGNKVTVIDKLIYSEQSTEIKKELQDKYPQVGFYEIDLVNKSDVLDFFVNHSFDGVFHLAALPSHRISLSFPFEYFENDLQATLNILESIRKVCPKTRVVFASTNKVYSDSEIFVSEASSVDPKGPYAISKYQSEQWCNYYVSWFGLKIATVRLFHVIGSRMQPNREIPIFLCSILEGRPIHLHGRFFESGVFESAYFGYTNVYDTVSGISLVMDNIAGFANHQVYNIGSDEKYYVSDVLSRISTKISKKVQIVNTPMMEHESMGCVADTTKLQKLGWKKQHTVEEAISDFVGWYLSTERNEVSGVKKLSGVLF